MCQVSSSEAVLPRYLHDPTRIINALHTSSGYLTIMVKGDLDVHPCAPPRSECTHRRGLYGPAIPSPEVERSILRRWGNTAGRNCGVNDLVTWESECNIHERGDLNGELVAVSLALGEKGVVPIVLSRVMTLFCRSQDWKATDS